MYNKNDMVLYGSEGVCKVIDIIDKEMDHKVNEYYVLKPINDIHSTIYVPTQNEKLTSKIKKVLSVQEIYELISNMPNEKEIWIDNFNERKEEYTKILYSGDRKELIRLIKTLYLHQEELRKMKKRLYTVDERILKEAINILHEEFAYVLHIKKDDVVPFIFEKIKLQEKM